MKRYFIRVPILIFFILLFSCVTTNSLIRNHFRSLEESDDVTVVLLGSSLFGRKWTTDKGLSYGGFLKSHLEDILKSQISIINSSVPYDTFNSTRLRLQEDILSYRPDIVFLILGVIDSSRPGLTKETYRQQVNEFLNILQKHKVFVVVMTSFGSRDLLSGFGSGAERLGEFNEIIQREAGLHRYPFIDVGEYMERLRTNNNKKFRSMFSNEYQLNENGQKFVLEFILKRIKKAVKNSG